MFPEKVTSSLKLEGLSYIRGKVYRDSSWEGERESHSRANSKHSIIKCSLSIKPFSI